MAATDARLASLARAGASSLLHGRIEARIERALQKRQDLGVREYSLQQIADALVLRQSATTRPVTRLKG
jgi:hypothetical protein